MKYCILILMSIIIFSSCSETKIVVKNNIPAKIFVDGREKGTGEVYINRFGFNKNVNVRVEYSGYPIADTTLTRNYNLKILIPTILSAGFFYSTSHNCRNFISKTIGKNN